MEAPVFVVLWKCWFKKVFGIVCGHILVQHIIPHPLDKKVFCCTESLSLARLDDFCIFLVRQIAGLSLQKWNVSTTCSHSCCDKTGLVQGQGIISSHTPVNVLRISRVIDWGRHIQFQGQIPMPQCGSCRCSRIQALIPLSLPEHGMTILPRC